MGLWSMTLTLLMIGWGVWGIRMASAREELGEQLDSVPPVAHSEALAFSQTVLMHQVRAIVQPYGAAAAAHRSLRLYEPSTDGSDGEYDNNNDDDDEFMSEADGQVAEVALQTICQSIQQSFASHHDVTCTCAGNIADSFSISCDYASPLCQSDDTINSSSTTTINSSSSSIITTGSASTRVDASHTCGKPQIAISMVQGKLFSATTCVTEQTRGTTTLQDTCIFVDACPDSNDGFCDCTASYGGDICDACRVCEGGHALTVNCTNVNAEAVSTQCSAVDLDWHLSDGAGAVAGFNPVFDGFCSQLEASLNNTIACDCTNAVGGTYALTCQTTTPLCVHSSSSSSSSSASNNYQSKSEHDLCGNVASTVHIVNGLMTSVTACAAYDAPFGETCTALQLCPASTDGDAKAASSDSLCGCTATYNGQACQSCSICEDLTSLTLDCSNVYPAAVTEQCQAVSSRTSFEFLPDYTRALRDTGGGGDTAIATQSAAAESRQTRLDTAIQHMLFLGTMMRICL